VSSDVDTLIFSSDPMWNYPCSEEQVKESAESPGPPARKTPEGHSHWPQVGSAPGGGQGRASDLLEGSYALPRESQFIGAREIGSVGQILGRLPVKRCKNPTFIAIMKFLKYCKKAIHIE
jgi:hypothetical protein